MPPLCVCGKTFYKVSVGQNAGGKLCMFCASCCKDNGEGQKLCTGCGALLGPLCSWCGSSNHADDVFCRGCHTRLPELQAARYDAESADEPESLGAGHYQIGRLLRACGAKRVYIAHDTWLDRKLAVAVISTRGLSAEARGQIMQVARSAARVTGHPHIAGVYEAGEEDGLVYVLSEYLAGGSLADLLSGSKDRGLPIADVLRIGVQICAALEYAHSFGVVHGDLTPASVMIAPDGSVKLSDFGLGLPLTISLSHLAGEGITIDSAAYAAPEQVSGGSPEPRGDLYSLGVMLYEMIAGSPPFVRGENPIAERLERKPPRLERADAPGALLSLVRRLLQKRPERRPPSAASVGDALRSMAATPRPRPIEIEPAPPPSRDASFQISAVGQVSGVGAMLSSANPWAALNVVSHAAPLSSAIVAVAMLAVISVGATRIAHKWFGQFNSVAAPRAEWPQLMAGPADLASAGVAHPQPEPLRAPAAAQPQQTVASIAVPASQTAARPENRARADSANSGPGGKPYQDAKPYAELIDLARGGDAAAQAALGNLYLRGEDAARNYGEAARWFEKAAAAGNPQAQVGLGYMYATGKGVTQDYKQAAKWFLMAGAKGDPDAEYNLALMYDQGQGLAADRSEALKWLRRAAAQDDARAQYDLGRQYMQGQGVEQDYSRALPWLRKAAAHGNIPAENALGYLYQKSGPELRDYSLALKWYRKAAEQGDARAQLNLGLMYEDGEGALADYAQAARWYRMASDQGEAYAQTRLGTLYCKGNGVRRDYAAANQWFRRAAAQDEPKAEYNLGIIYDTGLGVAKDYAEAVMWYRKAAAQGNVDAQYNLGYLYEHGEGVTRDASAALGWYRSAAIQGDSSALARVKVLQSKSD